MDINLCLTECARAVLLFRFQRDEWPDKSLELCELQSSHTTRVVNYDINVYYYACLSEEDHISGAAAAFVSWPSDTSTLHFHRLATI